jgi:hypothetical protein
MTADFSGFEIWIADAALKLLLRSKSVALRILSISTTWRLCYFNLALQNLQLTTFVFYHSKPRSTHHTSTRRVITAEAFWETINHGLPGDVDVRKDFGFDRCVSELEETNLLSLYRTMWVEELDLQELDGLLVEGRLAEKVEQWYEKVPEDDCDGYYLWFQRNPHIFPWRDPDWTMENRTVLRTSRFLFMMAVDGCHRLLGPFAGPMDNAQDNLLLGLLAIS